jgi:CRP-like cAMP-binding protein
MGAAMLSNSVVQALVFGLISAVSLPLGAIAARFWVPRDRVIAALMAFGAGALLSALTIDLVGGALEEGQFFALAGGAVLGGSLFILLDQLVSKKGGFLRKSATTLRYLRSLKAQKLQDLFKRLSQTDFFCRLPAEEIAALVPAIDSRQYSAGTLIIREGDPGDSLFIVESGSIRITAGVDDVATLGAGEVLGEMALVTGAPRSATATAATDCRVWIVLKEDFDRAIATSPHLADAVGKLTLQRISRLKTQKWIHDDAEKWFRQARRTVDEELLLPTATEIREAAGEHSGAPMAIWLGILLDGIPESLVIGASLVHSTISFSLIAGLFLSNFPEALSSSASMRQAHYSFKRILLMWTSLLVFTGVGAMLGNIFFTGAPPAVFALVEGIAAGAMLTMIAETMLPEAFQKGGAVTGVSTLLGFLAAIFFKTLE